ncbi:MAG: TolB family protein [Solirubrobacterales bacterium]
MKRAAAFILACAFVLAAMTPPALATDPKGARLAVMVDTLGDERGSDIITIGPGGEAPQTLVLGAGFIRPSWSADGNLLTLGATGDWKGTVVAVAEAERSGLRFYRRATLEGGNAVMAPSGRVVAFPRAKLVKVLPGRENYLYKSSIWMLDVETGLVRRKTPWRLQTFLEPSSFSPDGSKLAVTMFDRRGMTAVAVDLKTGYTLPLAKEASAPMYSPNGSEVAFIRWKNWRASAADDGSPPINELRVAQVGSFSSSRLLLRKRNLLAEPSWDPSGHRLAFILSRVVENGYSDPQEGDKLMAVNADGTCLTRLFSEPQVVVSGPAWEPGPGREAGAISC